MLSFFLLIAGRMLGLWDDDPSGQALNVRKSQEASVLLPLCGEWFLGFRIQA